MASKAWKVSTRTQGFSQSRIASRWSWGNRSYIYAICDSAVLRYWRDFFRRWSSRTCRWSGFARAASIAQVNSDKTGTHDARRCRCWEREREKKRKCPPTLRSALSVAVVAGTTAAPSAGPSGPSQMQQSAGGATGPRVIVLPTIEDIHLPLRYQRRPIDPKEIEYINVSRETNRWQLLTGILRW